MERDYNYDIMPEIKERYAVEYFIQEQISREELLPIFEAARYAPSCFNEQPWRYIIGDNPERHEKLAQCLSEGNAWAKAAPVLLLVMTKKTFALNDKENAWARFDAGTATGFLQLEAVRRGFAVHCMAGFSAKKARELFNIPDTLDIIAMVALGRPQDPEKLTEEQRQDQAPGTRSPLETFILD